MQVRGNFFLVGLMGAGKTTVGKHLAKRLAKTFVDADQEIERRTGVNIPLIFEVEGEAGFRAREAALLDELIAMQDIVLATGGGVVLSEKNREKLVRNGTVIYLRARVDDLWRRTRYDKHRPLLQSTNPRARLEELFQHRDPLYEAVADIIIDTGDQSVHRLVRELEQKIVALGK
jgi:shikimate kinase